MAGYFNLKNLSLNVNRTLKIISDSLTEFTLDRILYYCIFLKASYVVTVANYFLNTLFGFVYNISLFLWSYIIGNYDLGSAVLDIFINNSVRIMGRSLLDLRFYDNYPAFCYRTRPESAINVFNAGVVLFDKDCYLIKALFNTSIKEQKDEMAENYIRYFLKRFIVIFNIYSIMVYRFTGRNDLYQILYALEIAAWTSSLCTFIKTKIAYSGMKIFGIDCKQFICL